MSTEVIDSVKLEKIERVIESVKKHYEGEPERIPDIDISFEFLIASLFPKVFDNVKERLVKEHTLGYMEGYEDGKNENKGNS